MAFILENFFHAQRQHMIDAYPRYAELLARRGGALATVADRRAAAARFSRDDLRDLQVWHKLAWIDPLYLDGDARVRALVAKGRGFSEDDKAVLREVELELLNKVIPEYRDAAGRGQIELSTSPFYHPILPLLCDTDVYLRTHPDSRLPRQRFRHPEDAAEQLERAAAPATSGCSARRPIGLWPSEGSVSDAMVPLVAAAGFRWMATDELILARTLGITFSRDGRGQVEQPERLYTPYIVRAGDATVACTFRDHVLSDLIGFTYSGWAAEAAADDFVARLVEAGRRYRGRTGGGEALIPIILDGENAWEHFEGGGRPFLRALYRRLSGHPELRTVTMAEACAAATRELTGIFPGSWIDANFYIWIGHADDQKAWSQLAEARAALDARPSRRRPDRPGAPEKNADRRRQRLVLVVRRRPFVGPRPRVRRPVPAPSAERLPAAAEAGSRRAVRQQHLDGRGAGDPDGADGAAGADAGRRGDELLRVARRRRSRGPRSRRRDAPGRSPAVPILTLVQFGFDRERLFVRWTAAGDWRTCWRRASSSR